MKEKDIKDFGTGSVYSQRHVRKIQYSSVFSVDVDLLQIKHG